jgi:Lar family restriction alleviation protein
MANPRLLPCPFCRGTDLVYRKDYAEDDPTHCYAIHVFCQDCHAHGRNNYPIGWCESEEAAAEAWNDREPPRIERAGYVTEYIAGQLKRGTSGTFTATQEKTWMRPVPIYVGRAERVDDD